MRSAFRPAALLLIASLLWLVGVPQSGAGRGPVPGEGSNKRHGKAGPEAGAVEARFTDGSSLKLTLKDERIELTTPYGKLRIPVGDIQRIEFATRIPEKTLKRIETNIGALASSEFTLREDASAELSKLGERAYPALVLAAQSKDAEVVRRVEKLLDVLRDQLPEDALEFRKNDVIYTADSKISGQIDGTALKAQTFQFGEVRLKLADLRGLRSLAVAVEPEDRAALPNPGHLHAYANQFGKVFRFRVTGSSDGGLWGSDVYTLDSALAKAAVHAGMLKAGQTGVVKVRIIPSPAGFFGTTRHGVSSGNYAAYPAGAYQFVK